MPPHNRSRTVRQSSLRRRKRKSGRKSPSRLRGASSSPRGVPLAFQEFNRVKQDAEFRGVDTFDWNGRTYERHEWTSGVPVWRRA